MADVKISALPGSSTIDPDLSPIPAVVNNVTSRVSAMLMTSTCLSAGIQTPVSLVPIGGNVTIQPTGAGKTLIGSGATGNIDNITIGATTRADGSFDELKYYNGGTGVGGFTFDQMSTTDMVEFSGDPLNFDASLNFYPSTPDAAFFMDLGNSGAGSATFVKATFCGYGQKLWSVTSGGDFYPEKGGTTTMTSGFLFFPSGPGAPTGSPTFLPSGAVQSYYDTTNDALYVYNGSWKQAGGGTTTLDVGVTPVTGGVSGRVFYNNAGKFDEYPITGANSVVLRNASQNVSANAFFSNSASTAASGTLITLTAASAPFQIITGSGGQTIRLPDATTLPVGATYSVRNNQSSGNVIVQNSAGTIVATVEPTAFYYIVSLSNGTATGTWDVRSEIPSNVSWSTTNLTFAGGTINSGPHVITATTTNALTVGQNGLTNPAFNVDTNTAGSTTGLQVRSAGPGGGVLITALSSGTNEAIQINAKGSGSILLNGTATGAIIIGRNLTFNTDNANDIGSSNANRPRTINSTGGISHAAVSTKTADYTATANDYALAFNGTATVTLTLPNAVNQPGRVYWLQNISAQFLITTGAIIRQMGGGATSNVILPATAKAWCMLQSNGTDWTILANGVGT